MPQFVCSLIKQNCWNCRLCPKSLALWEPDEEVCAKEKNKGTFFHQARKSGNYSVSSLFKDPFELLETVKSEF